MKIFYDAFKFGKSVVKSKKVKQSFSKSKKEYEKKLEKTKAGRKELEKMKAQEKVAKKAFNSITQPLGKVLTSARKIANNLTSIEMIGKLKRNMKTEVIKKKVPVRNKTNYVHVQASGTKVANVSSADFKINEYSKKNREMEVRAALIAFPEKYKTSAEARAALTKFKEYDYLLEYKNIKRLIENKRWEDWVKVYGNIGVDPLDLAFSNGGRGGPKTNLNSNKPANKQTNLTNTATNKKTPQATTGNTAKPANKPAQPTNNLTQGTAKAVQLSNKQISHILTRHSANSVKNQIQYWQKKMTNEQIDQMLSKRTFFNKGWTDEKIIQASTTAYNQLRKKGVKEGVHSVTVFGEEIKVFLRNGNLDSAYGTHKYKLKDLLK